jgi:hypothetical protein
MTVPAQRLWVPFSLRRGTLIGFAFLFASLAIILGVLYRISNQNQGLASPSQRYHYLWTYFPSTTFIIISGFWYLVESNSKLLAPWRAIAERPNTLLHSLRLDYSSEFRYITLFSSAKNAHWNVWIAVVGTFSLNIIILLSTGLLTIESRTVVDVDASFTVGTIFNGTSDVKIPTEGLSTTYGLRYGLKYPNGTTSTFAYQSLKTIDFATGSTAQLTVDAFYPQASCMKITGEWSFGNVQLRKNMSRVYPGVKRKLQWPGCEKTGASSFILDPGLVETTAGLETYSLSVVPNPCEGDLAPNTTWEQFGVVASRMTLVNTNTNLTNAKKYYTQWKPTNNTNGIGEDVNGDGSVYFSPVPLAMISSEIVGVLCTTTPKLGKAEVSISQGTISATAIPINDSEAKLNRTLGWQLQRAMYVALDNDAPYLTGYNFTPYVGRDLSLEKYSAQYAPFFQLLNGTDLRHTVKDFVDIEFLMKSVPKVMDGVAVQIAATDYFTSSEEQVTGVRVVEMDRLVVAPLSLGFILGLLGLMTLISIALCIWPEGVVACDPASIAGIATLLVDRTDILNASHGLDAEEVAEVDRQFDKNESNGTISTVSEVTFDKNGAGLTMISTRSTSRPAKKIWWNPWSALLPVSFLVLLLPCVGIAVLEALLRLSQNSRGIATASLDQYVQYWWVYVPVLVIFSLNSLFDAISSTNRTIQPYATMHERPSFASRSVKVDLVHRTTFSALYKATSSKHLGVVAALIATLLGWTLPIAASSLFTARNVQESTPVTLQQINHFDPTTSLVSLSKAQESSLPLPGLILYNNLSSPRWTYGKYAFPQLELPNPSLNRTTYVTQNASLRLELPGVYGVSNCTVQNDTTWSVDFSGNRTDATPDGRIFPLVTLKSKPLAGCPVLPCDLMPSSDKFYMANWKSITEIRSLNRLTVPKSDQPSSNSSAATYHGKDALPAHCPRSVMCTAKGIAKARYISNSVSNITSLPVLEEGKIMHCWPYVEQEIVNVELSLPNFDILPANPPVPVDGTRSFFSEAELVNTADFQSHLPRKALAKLGDYLVEFDNIFKAVSSGSKGVDPVAVAKDDAESMKVLYRRIDEVYGVIVAQTYSEKRRFATPTNDSAFVLNGTLTTSTASRVLQNEVSTRIIQALLAAMILCALGTILFTDARRIIPDRPCSIGTVAGLLARSSILNEKRYLLEEDFRSGDGLYEMGVRERYSLGWWGEKESRWYGIDVGRADKEE